MCVQVLGTRWAVHKRLNRFRCRLGADSFGHKGSCILDGACWEGQSLLFRLSRDPELFGAKLGWTMAPLPRPLKSAYETGFMSLPHEKGNFMEIFAWRQIRGSAKVDALRRWVCGGDASF